MVLLPVPPDQVSRCPWARHPSSPITPAAVRVCVSECVCLRLRTTAAPDELTGWRSCRQINFCLPLKQWVTIVPVWSLNRLKDHVIRSGCLTSFPLTAPYSETLQGSSHSNHSIYFTLQSNVQLKIGHIYSLQFIIILIYCSSSYHNFRLR